MPLLVAKTAQCLKLLVCKVRVGLVDLVSDLVSRAMCGSIDLSKTQREHHLLLTERQIERRALCAKVPVPKREFCVYIIARLLFNQTANVVPLREIWKVDHHILQIASRARGRNHLRDLLRLLVDLGRGGGLNGLDRTHL